MGSLSDTGRFLLAACASLMFGLACLGAALAPDSIECERARALLDCPTRL